MADHNRVTRRHFMQLSASVTATAPIATSASAAAAEWRNRQGDMAYRRLGRTNLMVSEFVFGGSPPLKDSTRHLEIALERGLNYLDTAAAYGRREGERKLGEFLKTSGVREKIFLASKVSFLDEARAEHTQAVYDAMSESERNAIDREVDRRLAADGLLNGDYTIDYFRPGQYELQIRSAYLSDAVMRRRQDKVRASINFTDFIVASVEESLQLLQTDYLDIIHCPHGVGSPGQMQMEEVREAYEKLKKAGKVRFLGASAHADPATLVKTAARLGFYDMVMPAFNYVNFRYFKDALRAAKQADLGVIAMKAARPLNVERVSSRFPTQVAQLQKVVPGGESLPVKAYQWALQQPMIAAVNSSMITEEQVTENLAVAGKTIELPPDQRLDLDD